MNTLLAHAQGNRDFSDSIYSAARFANREGKLDLGMFEQGMFSEGGDDYSRFLRRSIVLLQTLPLR